MLNKQFKLVLSITTTTAVFILTGCTTYPKQYTYSPTISINGSSESPVELPNPFAKTPRKKTEHVYTYNRNSSESHSNGNFQRHCTMEPDLPYGSLYGNSNVETVVFAN